MVADTYARTLHNITLGLLARRDLDELLENIILSAGQIAHTANVFIDLADEETNQIRPMVMMGIFRNQAWSSLSLGEGLSGKVLQSGAPLIVKDYDSWEGRLPSFSLGAIQSMVGIPLKSEARTLGVLGLAHDRQSQRVFSQEEIELLSHFAALATLTIENVRLYQSATKAADRKGYSLSSQPGGERRPGHRAGVRGRPSRRATGDAVRGFHCCLLRRSAP